MLPTAKLKPTQQTDFPKGERIALPAGKYGAKKVETEPNEDIRNSLLRVVNYNGPRLNKDTGEVQPNVDGCIAHSWLVASTNGIPGTGFLSINIHPSWMSLEAYSVAFNEGEPVEGTTEEKVTLFQNVILDRVKTSLKEANNDEPEAETIAFNRYIKRIQISLGQFFDLQTASGIAPELDTDFESVVGAEVGGTVESGFRDDTADVKRFWVPSR